MFLLTKPCTKLHGDLIGLVPFLFLSSRPARSAAYLSTPAPDITCSLPPFHFDPLPPLCTYANSCAQSMCYQHTDPFQHRIPPLSWNSKRTSYAYSYHISNPSIQISQNLQSKPNSYSISTTLSKTFQNMTISSPSSVGSYPIKTYTLTLEILNLIQRTLELPHPKPITALCHMSLNRMPPSLF